MNRRLVDEYKPTLEWIQESSISFIRTRITLRSGRRRESSGHCNPLVQNSSANSTHDLVIRSSNSLVQLLDAFTKLLFSFTRQRTRLYIKIRYFDLITLVHILRNSQIDAGLLLDVKQYNEEGISGVALLHRRINGDDKVHLTAVFVRQQEEPLNVVVRDFVVERLAVQVDKVGEELDVVAAARSHAVELG